MSNDAAGPVPWLPRVAAIGGGIFFAVAGIFAMASPRSFFDTLAKFEPYNQHFIQDIGAFQIGLGAVLLLAAFWQVRDVLAVALLGVGLGAVAHVVSHLIGKDLGGKPSTDIPFFAIAAAVLVAGGVVRMRQTR